MTKKALPIYSCIFTYCLLVSACANYSVFTGWDTPDTERIAGYTGEKLLRALEKNSGSTVFYETLSDAQTGRIRRSLDDLIQSPSESVSVKLRAAAAAVDLLIYTDRLVYTVVYNLADPFLESISGGSATVTSVFSFFMKPLQAEFASGRPMGDSLSRFFLRLYQITVYYDPDLVSAARAGSYGGSDLQKYLVASVVGGIVASTWKLLDGVRDDVEAVVPAAIEYICENVTDLQSLETVLTQLENWIKTQEAAGGNPSARAAAGSSANDIFKTYGEQLKLKAKVLGDIAENAGYETIGKSIAAVLKSFKTE